MLEILKSNKKAQSLTEWGVAVAAVVVVCMSVVMAFGPKMDNVWQYIQKHLDLDEKEAYAKVVDFS